MLFLFYFFLAESFVAVIKSALSNDSVVDDEELVGACEWKRMTCWQFWLRYIVCRDDGS